MQPAQSFLRDPRATAWGLVLCRGCLKRFVILPLNACFIVSWMEHFPGAWGPLLCVVQLFLPPAPALPRMGPPLLLQTCVSSHLPALPLTAAHPRAALLVLQIYMAEAHRGAGSVNTLGSSREESRRHSHLGEGGAPPKHLHQSRRDSYPRTEVLCPLWLWASHFHLAVGLVLHSAGPAETQIQSLRVKRLITVWTPSSAIPESQHLFTTLWTSQPALTGSSFASTLKTRRGIVIITPAWLGVVNIFGRRI